VEIVQRILLKLQPLAQVKVDIKSTFLLSVYRQLHILFIGDLYMDTKEKFKDFVRQNPVLLTHVKEGKMTWQKFYEIYDIYGEEESAWKDYLTVGTAATATTAAATSFDLMGFLKNLDLDSIQNSVNSMQRVLGLLQDMSSSKTSTVETRKPRPLYKHFED